MTIIRFMTHSYLDSLQYMHYQLSTDFHFDSDSLTCFLDYDSLTRFLFSTIRDSDSDSLT